MRGGGGEEGERKVHAIKLIATTLEYNDNPGYTATFNHEFSFSHICYISQWFRFGSKERRTWALPESTFFHGRQ